MVHSFTIITMKVVAILLLLVCHVTVAKNCKGFLRPCVKSNDCCLNRRCTWMKICMGKLYAPPSKNRTTDAPSTTPTSTQPITESPVTSSPSRQPTKIPSTKPTSSQPITERPTSAPVYIPVRVCWYNISFPNTPHALVQMYRLTFSFFVL